MVDSGAFSAWKLDVEFNRDRYIRFLQHNKHVIDHYISLDTIAGRNGERERDPELIERAAQQTRDDHLAIKDAGLHPIPVYHQDEPVKYLELMFKDREPYVALSPSLRAGPKEIRRWLTKTFALIPRTTKVHGLGVTAFALIRDFAWTSVDSATWIVASANGAILVPRYTDNRPDFTFQPVIIPVTRRLVAS